MIKRALAYDFFLQIKRRRKNFNKLSIKCQSYPNSTERHNIQKIYVYATTPNEYNEYYRSISLVK